MDGAAERKVILVTRQTRLEELVARFHTFAQAKFYVEHLGADFSDYEREHTAYLQSKRIVLGILQAYGRYQAIDRSFLPNFVFGRDDIVVALGQDGLVANTMKYLQGQPLIGVNPEPARYDGILLPFEPQGMANALGEVLRGRFVAKEVTMAKARLTNGQTLYAVNDLFIGPRSHISARYEIQIGSRKEKQSSSGLIVATGLGSTAWMKSIVTGALQIAGAYAMTTGQVEYAPMPWDANQLTFAVREPFPSRTSAASIVFGSVTEKQPLRLTSLMPENGVIFSDGIEADYLEFNSGTLATVEVAERKGILVDH
jgi:NAD kinase